MTGHLGENPREHIISGKWYMPLICAWSSEESQNTGQSSFLKDFRLEIEILIIPLLP